MKLGPNLPIRLISSTMVTSPTGKGVVMICGHRLDVQKKGFAKGCSDILIELSGESRETLKWTILDRKLKQKRSQHVSFPITHMSYVELKHLHTGHSQVIQKWQLNLQGRNEPSLLIFLSKYFNLLGKYLISVFCG